MGQLVEVARWIARRVPIILGLDLRLTLGPVHVALAQAGRLRLVRRIAHAAVTSQLLRASDTHILKSNYSNFN